MANIKLNVNLELGFGRKRKSEENVISWRRIRRIVKRRDGAICQYCGASAPHGHVDHIKAQSRGGRDDIANLTWSCPSCNLSKGAKDAREFVRQLETVNDFVDDPELPDNERVIFLYERDVPLNQIQYRVYGDMGGTWYHKINAIISSVTSETD